MDLALNFQKSFFRRTIFLLKTLFVFNFSWIKRTKQKNERNKKRTTNIEKKDKPFSEWLDEQYSNESDKGNYLVQNHISTETSLKFEDFLIFYDKRRETIKIKLMQILNVKAGEELVIDIEE